MEFLKILVVMMVITFVTSIPVADDTPVQTTDLPATTLEDDDDVGVEELTKRNNFAFAFETENGQVRDENIQLEPGLPLAPMQVKIKGSYSFISADGYEYTVFYKADKKGYRPYVTAHKIKDDKAS